MDWKKRLLLAAGYLAVFLVVLAVSLYLTFDANALIPMIQSQAEKSGVDLEVQNAELSGLLGLDLRGLRISPASNPPAGESTPMAIDRMIISPSFSTVLALAGGGTQKGGPLAFDFEVQMGPGRIEGSFKQDKESLRLDTSARDLPLERFTLLSKYVENMSLSGRMNGDIKLDLQDRNRPDTWNGKIELDLDRMAVSDFKYLGLTLTGFKVDKGTFIGEIESGTLNVNPLKFQSQEIPLNLTGTVALKNPPTKSILDLKGTLNIGQEYKDKNPLISGFLPPTDKYAYQGTVEGLLKGM